MDDLKSILERVEQKKFLEFAASQLQNQIQIQVVETDDSRLDQSKDDLGFFTKEKGQNV